MHGGGGLTGFRHTAEDRERLMNRQYFDRDLGELQKSIERGSPHAPSLSHLAAGGAFNPLIFGQGLPSIESLKKQEEDMRVKEGGKVGPVSTGQGSMSSPQGQMGNGSGSSGKGPFSPDKLRQMGVINADAFCEICCKEFCNKYFLRVHKLKKHGFCSPDLPPEKVRLSFLATPTAHAHSKIFILQMHS